MSGRIDRIARLAIERSLELLRRRLWERVECDSILQLVLPCEEHPVAAALMGHVGEEYGLLMLRGPDAVAMLARGILHEDRRVFDVEGDMLSVSFERYADIAQPFREVFVQAGLSPRREQVAPMVFVRRPGGRPRPVRPSDVTTVAWALCGLLVADDSGTLRSSRRSDEVLEIAVSGKLSAPETVVRLVSHPALAWTESAQDESAWELSEEPQSLAEWKAAERAVTGRIMAEIERQEAVTERARKRYRGTSEPVGGAEAEMRDVRSEFIAFIDWLVADYRATHKSRTLLEKLLARPDLTAVERTLLLARRDAKLSIYRIDAAKPGESIDVEDVLDGERLVVHDASLSTCGVVGLGMPMRLQRIGSWVFPCIAGPPLSPLQFDGALDHLEQRGAELTPEGLRRASHLLGLLWDWVHIERPVRMENTDGDPLAHQLAQFSVTDAGAVLFALERRADLTRDPATGNWTWLRQPRDGRGETIVLGRLELLGDVLLVEVNSERRLRDARTWIETIPGVAFVSVTARAMTREGLPLDDRMPSAEDDDDPVPPAVLADFERQYVEHCLRWLDTPLPILGDLTPRVACATHDGRQRVARLIRTMPAVPVGDGRTFTPPRDRMLAELGLLERGDETGAR